MLVTYLPLPTFKESLRVLTTPDLFQSVRNVLTILDHNATYKRIALTSPEIEMKDEPGAAMWRGYEGVLKLYGHSGISELIHRDQEVGVLRAELDKWGHPNLDKLPGWFFGMDQTEKNQLMMSHRGLLLRMNSEYLDTFGYMNLPLPPVSHVWHKDWYNRVYFPRYNPPVVDPVLQSK